jgi:single-strand DNA-binding protein
MNKRDSEIKIPTVNRMIFVGRVVKDAELKAATDGTAICLFDVAINNKVRNKMTGEYNDLPATFVPVYFCEDDAFKISTKLKRGIPVEVEGMVNLRRWKRSDGARMKRLECFARSVEIISMLMNGE